MQGILNEKLTLLFAILKIFLKFYFEIIKWRLKPAFGLIPKDGFNLPLIKLYRPTKHYLALLDII